jgi:hypothetical protein
VIGNLDECRLRLRCGNDPHRNSSVEGVKCDEKVRILDCHHEGSQILHNDSLGLNYALHLPSSLHYEHAMYREVPAPSLQVEAPSLMS